MLEYTTVEVNLWNAADRLNRLAKDGWRVIACLQMSSNYDLFYTLERMKQPEGGYER